MSIPPHIVACLSLEQVFRLLYSTAFAWAVQRNSHVKWVEYRDSRVLNFLYGVMPWKGRPGWAELDQNWQEIRRDTIDLFKGQVDVFLRKLDAGPKVVIEYLEQMEWQRNQAQQGWMSTLNEVHEINEGVMAETSRAIRNLALVKAASTIAIAVMSGGAAIVVGGSTAVAAGAVNFGYSVTAAVAKNLAQAKGAGAIALDVGIEGGKEAANQLSGKTAGAAAQRVEALGVVKVFLETGKWQEAVKKIETLSVQLARKRSSAKIASLGRKVAAAQVQATTARAGMTQGVKLIRAAGTLRAAVPVVFAGLDVLLAIKEYGEDTAGL